MPDTTLRRKYAYGSRVVNDPSHGPAASRSATGEPLVYLRRGVVHSIHCHALNINMPNNPTPKPPNPQPGRPPAGKDTTLNRFNQPIGFAVPDWQPPPLPSREPMSGRFCRVEALEPERHARSLFDANALDMEGRNWTYLFSEPFADFDSYYAWLTKAAAETDPLVYAIVDNALERAVGVASYLRIAPQHGSIEVGGINFSPLLQQKPAATEAMYLMMQQAFAQGYRRYEWKCDALNAPSRRAAQRLGFSFEGIFRQALVYKGRNRDTAWFAVMDWEWPQLQAAFETWLDPANFDNAGRQKIALSALTAPLLKAKDVPASLLP